MPLMVSLSFVAHGRPLQQKNVESMVGCMEASCTTYMKMYDSLFVLPDT